MTLERRRPRFVEGAEASRRQLSRVLLLHPKVFTRKLGCEIVNEPLGTSCEAPSAAESMARVDSLAGNSMLHSDEWNHQRARAGARVEQAKIARYGTIEWLFRAMPNREGLH